MKITISRILSTPLPPLIHFMSEIGCANSLWYGEKPIIGHEYFVEIDIRGELIWEKDIIKSQDIFYYIQDINDQIILNGYLESYDEDGLGILKMNDSLIQFMSKGDAFSIGTFIKLMPQEISMYSINY